MNFLFELLKGIPKALRRCLTGAQKMKCESFCRLGPYAGELLELLDGSLDLGREEGHEKGLLG